MNHFSQRVIWAHYRVPRTLAEYHSQLSFVETSNPIRLWPTLRKKMQLANQCFQAEHEAGFLLNDLGLTSAFPYPGTLFLYMFASLAAQRNTFWKRGGEINRFCQVGFEPLFHTTVECVARMCAVESEAADGEPFLRGFLMVLNLCSIYTPKHACSSVIYLGIFKL